MAGADQDLVKDYLERSRDVVVRAAADPALQTAILAVANAITTAFRAGRKVMLAGNGGSAADAQHIATEFLSRYKANRKPLPAIALTTDTSLLTAIGNDFGFEEIFERQVRGLGQKGDIFIGISTSGRSQNVLRALKAAREHGVVAIGFTGNAGEMGKLCDLLLAAPSDETPLIQQVHIIAAHAICELVERELFGAPPAA